MSADRDTRADMLRPGDTVRYMGEWLEIAKVQHGLDRLTPEFGSLVVMTTDEEPSRTVFFRAGHFVAAECEPRPDALAGVLA